MRRAMGQLQNLLLSSEHVVLSHQTFNVLLLLVYTVKLLHVLKKKGAYDQTVRESNMDRSHH